MTRLCLGEEDSCVRCEKAIPPSEIGVIHEGHRFCGGCWSLWNTLRKKTLAELLITFLSLEKKDA